MNEFLPSIHEQAAIEREAVLRELHDMFKYGAAVDELSLPCLPEHGLVPLLAGVVDRPEEPLIDNARVYLYDMSKRCEPIFRIEVADPEQPSHPAIYTLEQKRGMYTDGLTEPEPLDQHEYVDLRANLQSTVLDVIDRDIALDTLEDDGRLLDLDDYLRQQLPWTRRQQAAFFVRRMFDTIGKYNRYGPFWL